MFGYELWLKIKDRDWRKPKLTELDSGTRSKIGSWKIHKLFKETYTEITWFDNIQKYFIPIK